MKILIQRSTWQLKRPNQLQAVPAANNGEGTEVAEMHKYFIANFYSTEIMFLFFPVSNSIIFAI